MCGKYSLLWLYQPWLAPLWWTQAEETFVPHSIFQLIIYICTSGRVCVDKWDHPFLWDFFILPKTFFLSRAPGKELDNNNRAKSLLSHLVSAVQCLLQGVASGHSGGVNSKDSKVQLESAAVPSSDNMGYFQASLASGWVLDRSGKQEPGTHVFKLFFSPFVFVWIWEKHNKLKL